MCVHTYIYRRLSRRRRVFISIFYVITIFGNSLFRSFVSFLSYKLLIHRDITIYGKKSSFERKERERESEKKYKYKRKKDDDGETKKHTRKNLIKSMRISNRVSHNI